MIFRFRGRPRLLAAGVVPPRRPEDNPVAHVREFDLPYSANVVNLEWARRFKAEGNATGLERLRRVGTGRGPR